MRHSASASVLEKTFLRGTLTTLAILLSHPGSLTRGGFATNFRPPSHLPQNLRYLLWEREREMSLIDAFLNTGTWQIGDLKDLNTVRRYKCVYSKSDLFQPDGQTILPSIMDKLPGSSDWTFPHEKPTKNQFELWCTALQHLSSPKLQLQRSIGHYINAPHKKTGWYLSNSNRYLYKTLDNGTFETHRIAPDACKSWRPKYVRCIPSSIPPLDPSTCKYAAVKVKSSARTVSILSSSWAFCPPT